MNAAGYRRDLRRQALAIGRELLLDSADVDQRLEQRIGGRARGEVGPPGAELVALRRPRPVLLLLLRQQAGEQRLDRWRVVGHARLAQVRPVGRLARRGVDVGEPGALGFQCGDQRRVRRGVQQDAAQLHAHHRRDGADLNIVGRAALAEQRQDRLGEPPGHDRVARRVGDLCEGQMLRAPVGSLQGLVQREAEIAGGRGLQRGRVRPVEQAYGLQGAVDADRLDAALGEVAEVERRVVHDDRPLPDRREHGPVDLVQVDHRDAGPAAVERAQPRRRTVRIEAGPPGVVLGALQRRKLRLGDRERRAAPRRAAARRSAQAFALPFAAATRRERSLSAPARSAAAVVSKSTAMRPSPASATIAATRAAAVAASVA